MKEVSRANLTAITPAFAAEGKPAHRAKEKESPTQDIQDSFVSTAKEADSKHAASKPSKLLPVPDTSQSTDYSCGASALQAVLAYYGKEYSEPELMKMLHTTPKDGTNPKDIVRVARKLGFDAELRENLTIADIEKPVKKGKPVIVAIQAWREGAELNKPWSEVWDSGHYVSIIGSDEKNLYFEDPSLLGSRGFIPRKEFVDRWHDVDDKKYFQSAIFIEGKKPTPPPTYLHIE